MFWGLLTQEIFGGNLFEDVARAQEILAVQSYILQLKLNIDFWPKAIFFKDFLQDF